MPDEAPSDSERDLSRSGSGLLTVSGRVEAFSDGVIAIAITLLVLNLKVPDGEPGTVVRHLLDQWTSYVAYLASFFFVGIVWVSHHALFTRIARVDSGVLWRNLILLLAVSVFPFPTATLAYAMQHGSHGDQSAALALYGLVSAVMGASWLIIFAYLDRHHELLHDDVAPGFFHEERRRAVFGILSPLAAVAIGAVAPAVALVAFVLLPVFYAFTAEGRTARRTT